MERYSIPEIADEILENLAGRIRPMFRLPDGVLAWMQTPRDLRGVSFLWDPQAAGLAENLEKLGEVETLHTFGYYGFFKPSVAEVLSQIPEELRKVAVGFETHGPRDAEELQKQWGAINAGFHVAKTTIYGKRKMRDAMSGLTNDQRAAWDAHKEYERSSR